MPTPQHTSHWGWGPDEHTEPRARSCGPTAPGLPPRSGPPSASLYSCTTGDPKTDTPPHPHPHGLRSLPSSTPGKPTRGAPRDTPRPSHPTERDPLYPRRFPLSPGRLSSPPLPSPAPPLPPRTGPTAATARTRNIRLPPPRGFPGVAGNCSLCSPVAAALSQACPARGLQLL